MTVLARLSAEVSRDAAAAALAVLRALEQITPAAPGGRSLSIDATGVAGLADQLRPRAPTVQVVEPRFYIRGFPGGDLQFRETDLVGGWVVELDLQQGATVQFSVPATTGDWVRGPLGVEFDWGAPPPGVLPLDVDLVYLVNGQEVTYPLLVDGIVNDSDRNTVPHLLSLTFVGPEGRYDNKRVSLALDPGHGLNQAQLVRQLALAAGVPSSKIAIDQTIGTPRRKSVELSSVEWWPEAFEVAASAGHVPAWVRGELQLLPMAPVSSSPQHVFTERDLVGADVAGAVRVRSVAEVPTSIIVTGTSGELPDWSQGSRFIVERIETFDDYAPLYADWRQQSGGSLAAYLGQTVNPLIDQTFRRVGLILHQQEIRDGCVIAEDVLEWGYKNPEVWRYRLDSTGATVAWNDGFLFEAGAQANDGTPLYRFNRARWSLLSHQRTLYSRAFGRLVRKRIYYGEWLAVEEALKSRPDTSTAWETQPFLSSREILASGRAVMNGGELYYGGRITPGVGNSPTGQIITSDGRISYWARFEDLAIRNTADDYKAEERLWSYEWSADEGALYLWRSGEFADAESTWNKARGNRKLWTPTPGGRLTYIEKPQEFLRQDQPQARVEQSIGGPPAAEICDPAQTARRFSRPVFGRCDSTASRVPSEEEQANDYVESPAEARDLACLLLRRQGAIEVEVPVPVRASVNQGDTCRVVFPSLKIIGPGWVERVRTERQSEAGNLGPLLTRAVCMIPPKDSP